MDLWNASPAGADASKMRHNQSGAPAAVAPSTIMGREVAPSEQWIQVWISLLIFLICSEHVLAFLSQHLTSSVYVNMLQKRLSC